MQKHTLARLVLTKSAKRSSNIEWSKLFDGEKFEGNAGEGEYDDEYENTTFYWS